MKHSFRTLILSTAFLAFGCGSVHSSYNSHVPTGVDLSGNWVLDQERNQGEINRDASQREFEKDSIDGKTTTPLGSLYFAESDFPVVSADRLEIEQDEESIGILYSVGKYRDLVWGVQTRGAWELDVGWEGKTLVIRSTISHSRGVETYELNEDRTTLRVVVQIRAGNERRNLRRIFVRET